jgi:hypothetical protein
MRPLAGFGVEMSKSPDFDCKEFVHVVPAVATDR